MQETATWTQMHSIGSWEAGYIESLKVQVYGLGNVGEEKLHAELDETGTLRKQTEELLLLLSTFTLFWSFKSNLEDSRSIKADILI